jgi:hypothetical protein
MINAGNLTAKIDYKKNKIYLKIPNKENRLHFWDQIIIFIKKII